MLKINKLNVAVEDKNILKNINLKINKGELHVIMGRNGTGKSTLSNVIAGKEGYSIDQGDILYKTRIFIECGEKCKVHSMVEYDKIIAKILAVSKNRTDTRIYVRGDKSINYGRVLEIMGMLSGSGFTKVALISEPYKDR